MSNPTDKYSLSSLTGAKQYHTEGVGLGSIMIQGSPYGGTLRAPIDSGIRGSSRLPSSIEDYEMHIFKRMRSIGELIGTLMDNISKFSILIEDCNRDYVLSDQTMIIKTKSELVRLIQDITGSHYTNTNSYLGGTRYKSDMQLTDKLKHLESLFFEHDSQLSSIVSKKDNTFSYLLKETLSFSNITTKISDEVGSQTKSLSKRFAGLFAQLNSDDISRMSPAKEANREFSEKAELEIASLKRQLSAAKEIIESSKSENDFGQDISALMKENFNLKMNNYMKKLNSLHSLTQDRLTLYDERIENLESTLTEKIKYVKQADSGHISANKITRHSPEQIIEKLSIELKSLKDANTELILARSTFEGNEVLLNSKVKHLEEANKTLLKRLAETSKHISAEAPEIGLSSTQRMNAFKNHRSTTLPIHEIPLEMLTEEERIIKKLKDEIIEYEKHLAEVKKQNKEFSEQIERLTDELNERKEKEKESEKHVKMSSFSQFKSTEKDSSKLQEQINLLEGEKEQMIFEHKTRIDEITIQLKDLTSKNDEIAQELAGVREELALTQESDNEHSNQALDLKGEVERLHKELNNKIEEVNTLKTDIVSKETVLIELRCRIDDLESETAKVSATGVAPVEPGVLQVSDESKLRELETEVQDLRSQKLNLISENEKLDASLKEEKEKFEKRMEIYSALKSRYQELQLELEEQEGVLAEVKEEKSDLAHTNKELNEKIVELNLKIAELVEKNELLNQEVIENETKLICNNSDIEQLKSEYQEMRSKLNSQSMNEFLTDVFDFSREELQKELDSILQCDNVSDIKQMISNFLVKLKNGQVKQPSSPVLSIGSPLSDFRRE